MSLSPAELGPGELAAGLEEYDVAELCELAALICVTPISGTHVVGADGVPRMAWYGEQPTGVPFEATPCAEVLASGQPLVIDDLSLAVRRDGSPWELSELRAYAGVPINLGLGGPIGTICVFDTVERPFGAAQIRALELLAKQIARSIQLMRSTGEVERAARERASAEAQLGRIERRFHALVESSPLAIFALDAEAKPVFVSDGCAMLFGTAQDRYDKTGWIPAVHESDRARATSEWARAVSRQVSVELQYRIYNAEGKIQELAVSAAAIHGDGGDFGGWVGTVSDITKQTEANRALARARRAAERARADVEARNAELQALARTKDTFLAAVSHEFRTPLTSIATFLQMLTEDDPLSESQRQAVGVIARNAERLNRLVTDLLNIKEAPGAMDVHPETVDLREAAADAVETAALRAREAGVELTASDGPPVWGRADPKRIAQVIDGLLDNALKFTPAGGRIAVGVAHTEQGARIEIADTGVGMDEHDLERVFERFYQGAAGRASGSGSGLGLAIAQRLLDAQGATIAAESRTGRGTTIRIELRGGEAPAAAAPAAA
ncbi:MAG TPA: ATP-binding protein [Solirubrobacteraceae bacterium]|nr:ATP-binding protein [Solirubrobacteraceae bacterium]